MKKVFLEFPLGRFREIINKNLKKIIHIILLSNTLLDRCLIFLASYYFLYGHHLINNLKNWRKIISPILVFFLLQLPD
jgi:hypothetical protein